MKIRLRHTFEEIISVENLLGAWKEFVNGKRDKKDVQIFQMKLMDNIFSLHRDLSNHTYKHGGYQAFKINDPKPRAIHKATVRDRLLHHAIYRILYPFFDKIFISDSYSCRLEKGTHKAINKFQKYFWKVSKNDTKTCWVLKCDIKKFFANIDHEILTNLLKEHISDENIIILLKKIINSFSAENSKRVGLPLGNLTSQLFVNIYMNKFDQFIKHKLKVKYYIRYSDDFVLFSQNRNWLENQVKSIEKFLFDVLKLELHPDKISIKTASSGVDFLGVVNFDNYRLLRTKTKRRMFKKVKDKCENYKNKKITLESFNQTVQSYLGMLKHFNGRYIKEKIKEIIGFDKNL